MTPPLRIGWTEAQYRAHFEKEYCQGPILTHDGIEVYFRKKDFDHCMFESSRRTGDKLPIISLVRAERIDWIKATLQNPTADLYPGWDKSKKRVDNSHRVAVAYEEFVVVIRIKVGKSDVVKKADFKTAYLADNSIEKIRAASPWKP